MIKVKKPIKWGIIGCGDVTEVKSGPPYQIVDGFELKAVMRRDFEKARDYAQRHGVEKYYASAEDLINDVEVDAVYIATPPDSQHQYAILVAQAGKPCCIEKPMATTYHESLEIYEAFQDKNIPLFIAYYRRSLPRFEKVREWIENGLIGKVRHITWQLLQPASAVDLSGEYNWRTDAKVAPGGYFDDLASHGLDLFAWYLGDITDVYGIATNQQGLYTAKDAISASWKHEGGITGSGTWNFGAREKVDNVEIYGSKGTIQFAVFEDSPVLIESDLLKQELTIAHPKHVQMPHVKNMAKHLFEEGYEHPSMGKSGLHTAWVMGEILQVS